MRLFLMMVTVAFWLGVSQPARAADISTNVSTTAQLVSAFATANNNPNNAYTVYLAPGTYYLSSPLVLNRGSLEVIGSENGTAIRDFVLDGQDQTTIIEAYSNSGNSSQTFLSLTGLVVTHGRAEGINGNGGGLRISGARANIRYTHIEDNKAYYYGAGMDVQSGGFVYMNTSLVRDNENLWFDDEPSSTDLNSGGGINVSGGFVNVDNSTIYGNKAHNGGGIHVGWYGGLSLYNTTVSSNEALKRGGGIYFAGNDSDIYTRFSTVTDNTVVGTVNDPNEARFGGGIAFERPLQGGQPAFYGNIIANNAVLNPLRVFGYYGHDCLRYSNVPEVVSFSQHGNVVGQLDNCNLLGESSYPGIGTEAAPVDPVLGPLAATPQHPRNVWQGHVSHLPLPGSPAIYGYDPSDSSGNLGSGDPFDPYCTTSDARGYSLGSSYSLGGSIQICSVGAIHAATEMAVASADTFARNGSYSGTNCNNATNCGSPEANLLSVKSSSGWGRETYLRFSGFTSGAVSEATLTLCAAVGASQSPNVARTIRVSGIISNTWAETSLTWNSRPTGALDSVNLSMSSLSGCMEFDVTAFANRRLSQGRTSVNFRVQDTSGLLTSFYNRSTGLTQPSLSVTY